MWSQVVRCMEWSQTQLTPWPDLWQLEQLLLCHQLLVLQLDWLLLLLVKMLSGISISITKFYLKNWSKYYDVCFRHVKEYCDGIIRVSDQQILGACWFRTSLGHQKIKYKLINLIYTNHLNVTEAAELSFRNGLVVEPSGGAGLAALLQHKLVRGEGDQVVVVVLTGGNVTPQEMATLTSRTEWWCKHQMIKYRQILQPKCCSGVGLLIAFTSIPAFQYLFKCLSSSHNFFYEMSHLTR